MVEVIDLPDEPKMYMSSPPIGTPEPNILSPAYALVEMGVTLFSFGSCLNWSRISKYLSTNSYFEIGHLDR